MRRERHGDRRQAGDRARRDRAPDRELGINYLLAYLFFGTMAYADASARSQLFAPR